MLLLALLLAVAAPVGGVPGIKHVVWQDAACELHPIMQLVTFEVCATRILAAASATEWHRTTVNPPPRISAQSRPSACSTSFRGAAERSDRYAVRI